MKKIVLFLIILIWILPIVSCNGRIEGYVYKTVARDKAEYDEYSTGPAIESVEISLSPSLTYDGTDDTTFTNQDGYFVFEGVTPSTYDLKFVAINYGSAEENRNNVQVEANVTVSFKENSAVRIELPTSPNFSCNRYGTYFSANSTTPYVCTVKTIVDNDGDCPLYGLEIVAEIFSSISRSSATLITTVPGNVDDYPIQPYNFSECTIADISCGDDEPKAVKFTITLPTTTATPSAWSIHKQ